MFKIDMLQAGWGDCLWIEYGNPEKPFRILIDGGIVPTYKLLEKRILDLPENERHFELFIITHVDGDHIEGAIKLLGNLTSLKVTFGDIWFNGYEHLEEKADDVLGGAYGEFLSGLLKVRKLNWNLAFGGKAVVVPDSGDLPEKPFADNLKITLLSPTRQSLKNLIPAWVEEIEKVGLGPNSTLKEVLAALEKRSSIRPGDELDDLLGDDEIDVKKLAGEEFDEDKAKANGSSIAILMEYDDAQNGKKTCLLTGDAFPSIVCKSMERLHAKEGKIALNLLKVSHHGSKNNTNNELLNMIECENYLFSSNGKKFGHPNMQTIARIISGATPRSEIKLYFNYRSKLTEIWDSGQLKKDFKYETIFASPTEEGIEVIL